MNGYLTVPDVLVALRRRWLLAVGVCAAIFLGTAIFTWMQTPLYEASAELLIKFGREFVYRPEVGDTAIVNRDRASVINAELQILRSYDLVSSVVSGVGVAKLYPDLAAVEGPTTVQLATQRFIGNYTAMVLPDADVLRVSFRHSDAQMTVEALTLLVDRFREKHLEAFGESGSVQFYEEKVAEYRALLDKVENSIKVFQSENRAYLDQGQPVLRQRETLEGDLKAIENQVAGLREKLKYLEAERAKLPADAAAAAGDRSPVVTEAKANLLKLQLQEQELLANFSENNRQVVNLRKQIELVKRFVEEQETAAAQTGPRGELATDIVNTMSELRFQEARRDNLRAQLASLDTQAQMLPQMEGRYRDLIRERDATEANYQNFTRRLEEARISAQMDQQKIANISVIQAPVAPLRPVSPRRSLNLAIGVFLGLALGGLAAILADRRDRVFESEASQADPPLGPVHATGRRDA